MALTPKLWWPRPSQSLPPSTTPAFTEHPPPSAPYPRGALRATTLTSRESAADGIWGRSIGGGSGGSSLGRLAQGEANHGAMAHAGVDADHAPVALHNRAGNVEAQPRPAH